MTKYMEEFYQQADVIVPGGNESQIRRAVAQDPRVGIVALEVTPKRLRVRLHAESPFAGQMAARLVEQYPGTISIETLQPK